MERERGHPGLVSINVAHGLMSLDVQTKLFEHALAQLAEVDLTDQVLEVTLTPDSTVRVGRYVTRVR